MYDSILVPLDGTSAAEWALPTAIRIARASGARIHLLTVEVPVPVLSAGMAVLPTPPTEMGELVTEDYLQHVAERLRGQDVEVNALGLVAPSALVFGSVGSKIAHRADVVRAGLIVMTTHARAAVPRMFMGSVARDVVSRSRIPVMLVKPQKDIEIELQAGPDLNEILIALDGSPFSEEVLADAVELGRCFGARFTLLTAIDPPHMYGAPVNPHLLPVDEIALGELKRSAQQYSDRIAERLRQRGVNVTTLFLTEANAGEAILHAAQKVGADLIALTTHARGGLATLLLGSVADHVVRGANIPVLLYRPREREAA